jgi:pilus assembly protein CpaB
MMSQNSIGGGSGGGAARVGAIGFTIAAIGLSAITGWLMLRLLTAGGYDKEPTHPVVIAAHDVEAGSLLQATDLKVVPWPNSSIPKGSFQRADELVSPVPRVLTESVVEGEPVLNDRLASPQAGAGLAGLVAPQMRALSLHIESSVVASRLIYPGARVDILATMHDHGIAITRTVLENVHVIAVGAHADVLSARRGNESSHSSLGGGGETEPVMTVEVTAKDAERLTLAVREGKIDVTLRNATDHVASELPGASSAEIVGVTMQEPGRRPESDVPPPRPRPAAAHVHATHRESTPAGIEVYRGPK